MDPEKEKRSFNDSLDIAGKLLINEDFVGPYSFSHCDESGAYLLAINYATHAGAN